jgi:hypothetical protein
VKIGELPFHERPILELLALEKDLTVEESRQYAGFGWTRTPAIWLNDELVTNALIIAVHADDHGEHVANDIELGFELPDQDVTVLLSAFLRVWLPRLPSDHTIVLAVCNPFNEILKIPGPAIRYPLGEARAWIETDRTPDISLEAETWCTLGA